MKYSNLIISVSSIDAQDLKNKYHKDVIYIPNGITLLENKVKPQDDYLFFAAARIYEIKGLDILLDAVKLINVPIKIKIAGDLDQIKSYRSKILLSAKNLDIEFLGLIKDKKELLKYINNAKLFIFPSLFEAMSMMLLEAASCKTPIIASDIASNKAIFNESEVLFFRNKDHQDLANKIHWALENYSTMETKSVKAFEKLKNEYRLDIIAHRYKKLYNSIK
jgi:glycosyltransferase involved in cell wall biosynthesis